MLTAREFLGALVTVAVLTLLYVGATHGFRIDPPGIDAATFGQVVVGVVLIAAVVLLVLGVARVSHDNDEWKGDQ